ncbi:hypothetical protein GLOIN_2v1487848 [Rhizophagus clarus]|uniref:Uncharacterized protein n=1 Tax=Rhizophagus clarus TaxID=94130 RepID=A0A8H3LA19_9GLOM|nr:hypothetical protein GLOIN_2v1487848 [Rhizophagus clarus]
MVQVTIQTIIQAKVQVTIQTVSISWYNIIKDKLKNEEICKSLRKEALNELVLSLGDEARFTNRYLKLDDLSQITRDLQNLDDLLIEEDVRSLVDSLLRHWRKSNKFGVYLFISKLNDDRSDSPFFRFLAKSVFRNRYGMFHVGLEIDGIVLEWGTGGAGPHLIYPRVDTERLYKKIAHIRVNSDSFVVSTQCECSLKTDSLFLTWCHNLYYIIFGMMRKLLSFAPNIGVIPSNKLQIIAQKCVYWNKYFYYNPLNRNCQHFIDEMLYALGLKFNPEGEFKRFLDRIVKYADDRFCSKRESSFRDKISINLLIRIGSRSQMLGIKDYFYVILICE